MTNAELQVGSQLGDYPDPDTIIRHFYLYLLPTQFDLFTYYIHCRPSNPKCANELNAPTTENPLGGDAVSLDSRTLDHMTNEQAPTLRL